MKNCNNSVILVNYSPDDLENIYELLKSEKLDDLEVDSKTEIISFKSNNYPKNLLIKTLSIQHPNITFLLDGVVKNEWKHQAVYKAGYYLELEEVNWDQKDKLNVFKSYLPGV